MTSPSKPSELTTLRTEVLELREAVRRGMVEAARLEAQRDEARTRAVAHRARVGELGRLVRELRAVAEEADDGQLAWEVVDDESPMGGGA
jgi:hypothetical protein